MSNLSEERVKEMVCRLRIPELKMVLDFGRLVKYGNKSELQKRCLDLLEKDTDPQLRQKIAEIFLNRPSVLTASASGRSKSNGSAEQGQVKNSDAIATSKSSGTKGFRRDVAVGPCPSPEPIPDSTSSIGEPASAQQTGKKRELAEEDDELIILEEIPAKRSNAGGTGPRQSFSQPPALKMKLPHFRGLIKVLMNPTKLFPAVGSNNAEQSWSFTLSLIPEDVSKVFWSRSFVEDSSGNKSIKFNKAVCLRFAAINTPNNGEEENDNLPPGLTITVNGQNIFILKHPDTNIPREQKPVDITRAIKCISDNKQTAWIDQSIKIQWLHRPDPKTGSPPPDYFVSAYLYEVIPSKNLFQILVERQVLPEFEAFNKIKSMLNMQMDEEVFVEPSAKMSLMCPLTRQRIRFPCRGINCKHVNCFDALSFLLMNEKRPKFMCPVCCAALKFEELRIDSYVVDILSKVAVNVCAVVINPNGSYKPVNWI